MMAKHSHVMTIEACDRKTHVLSRELMLRSVLLWWLHDTAKFMFIRESGHSFSPISKAPEVYLTMLTAIKYENSYYFHEIHTTVITSPENFRWWDSSKC